MGDIFCAVHSNIDATCMLGMLICYLSSTYTILGLRFDLFLVL